MSAISHRGCIPLGSFGMKSPPSTPFLLVSWKFLFLSVPLQIFLCIYTNPKELDEGADGGLDGRSFRMIAIVG